MQNILCVLFSQENLYSSRKPRDWVFSCMLEKSLRGNGGIKAVFMQDVIFPITLTLDYLIIVVT